MYIEMEYVDAVEEMQIYYSPCITIMAAPSPIYYHIHSKGFHIHQDQYRRGLLLAAYIYYRGLIYVY